MATFVCHDCKLEKPVQTDGGTGYGIYKRRDPTPGQTAPEADVKVCYACCAKRDSTRMLETGKATLYLTGTNSADYTIGNWPGSLKFPAREVRRFRHPFVREAWLGTFKGPDGKLWRFKNVGDSQLAYCKRAAG